MEPPNQQQQQFAGYYSSLLFQPDYKVPTTTLLNSGIIWERWASSRDSNMLNTDATANEMLLSNIKPEIPADSLSNLTEIKESSQYSLSATQPNNLFSDCFYSQFDNHILAQNNFLSTQYDSNDVQNTTSPVSESSFSCKFDFTHLLNLSNSESCLSNSLHPLPVNHNLFRDSPSTSSNQSTTTGKKRAVNNSESKSYSSEAKRHKPSSTSPCPPLKEAVKKERVRERIATLQRLIAPYGKTDTASVLTETIGYIQFLHDQMQTLSVPYIRSSSSCSPTTFNDPSLSKGDGRGQARRRDLSSRGLCLVPISSVSFFNSYNSGI